MVVTKGKLFCLTRVPWEFADDPLLHVGARVVIIDKGDKVFFTRGKRREKCFYGRTAHLTQIWADSFGNLEYVVSLGEKKRRTALRVFSDEIHPLHALKTISRIKKMKDVFLKPVGKASKFYVGARDVKTCSLGQYLKLNLGTGELSCHVVGSHTLQIIDAIGREKFNLKADYIRKLLEDSNFKQVELKSVSA